MFRCIASQAIPHLRSCTAIPCISLVLLGHTNRNVSLSAHKHLTPGHPVGRPPFTQAITGQNCLCLCAFFFPDTLYFVQHMSGGSNFKLLITKFMPISFCGRVSRFLRCSRTPGTPIRKLLVQHMLACCPVLSLNGLKLCKFVSLFLGSLCPKHLLLRLVLASEVSFIFSKVIFKSARRIPF